MLRRFWGVTAGMIERLAISFPLSLLGGFCRRVMGFAIVLSNWLLGCFIHGVMRIIIDLFIGLLGDGDAFAILAPFVLPEVVRHVKTW